MDIKNSNDKKKVVIIGISADISINLAKDWIKKGWQVFGTFRRDSEELDILKKDLVSLYPCDLESSDQVDSVSKKIIKDIGGWDILILGPGLQDPIGMFEHCDFDEWKKSIDVNFTNQLRFVHNLLPFRNTKNGNIPNVLFFAGGGTNNATLRYSAYTVSKIGLIKMTELLSAEIKDTKFLIVGPGWVKTKIHESTLKNKLGAGDNYDKTIFKLSSNECTPMIDVVDCINFLLKAEREIYSGRNFSVVFDSWDSEELKIALSQDDNMYKLRRSGNDILKKL